MDSRKRWPAPGVADRAEVPGYWRLGAEQPRQTHARCLDDPSADAARSADISGAKPADERKIVQRGGSYGRYLASGHIVYLHDAKIFVVPFDLERLEVTGPPFLALDGVSSNPNGGSAQFAASETRTFVYLSRPIGSPPMGGAPDSNGWIERDEGRRSARRRRIGATLGSRQTARASPSRSTTARNSPSGCTSGSTTEIPLHAEPGTESEAGMDTGRAPNRVLVEPGCSTESLLAAGRWHGRRAATDPQRVSAIGCFVASEREDPAFQETRRQTSADLMYIRIEGDEVTGWRPGTATSFLSTAATEREPMFSPDGKWLAYQANDSGAVRGVRAAVSGTWRDVADFDGRWDHPTWSRTRRELLYRSPENQLMVAAYTASGDSFRAEKPRLWAEGYIGPQTGQRSFDLHPDGERVAVAPELGSFDRPQDRLVFIFNFFDELRRMAAPTAKR